MASLPIVFRILIVMAVAIFGFWLLIKLLMGIGWTLGHVFRGIGAVFGRLGGFVSGMVRDALRLVGGVITAAFFVPAVCFNVILGRWSRANHYGRAMEGELLGIGTSAYRLGVGHVANLLGLKSLTEGFERRIPDALARAPGPDRPREGRLTFEGYTVVGSLPSGGSGARLFLAEPSAAKKEQYARAGQPDPGKVVIKSFSLADGSTMPQIVRESRALDAARRLGLVLEHELSGTRFHYVMPYVPGEDLSLVTQQLHAQAGPGGLGKRQVARVLGYTADLLQTLGRFHGQGLWHKDIKPSNIIVSDGRVQLVDLGLTTPLTSAMTLTTHGTEYFRDPELVRLALKGVKVNEVDGVKFDIYGVGAVLYSLIENSFPAHGSLSQIHKKCPEALRWITRKAMTDMSQRYASADEMLADVQAVLSARDPFKVKPAKLPSMNPAAREDDDCKPPLRGIAAAFGRARKARERTDAALEPIGARIDAMMTELDANIEAAFAPKHGSRRAAEEAGRKAVDAQHRSRRRSSWRFAALAAVVVAGAVLFGNAASEGELGRFFEEIVDGRSEGLDFQGARLRPAAYRTGGSLPVPLEVRLADRRPEPARVLVLDDLPSDLADHERVGLERLYDRVETAHFELLGVGRPHGVDPELAISEEARVRAVLGLGNPRDRDVVLRLNSFLEQEQHDLDAVVWIGRGDDGQLAYELAALRDVDKDDLHLLLDASPDAR